ncbi:MAG TPA: phosphohistidine phosphatase SixA [Ktedonobacterales bacterium]|nr:phosphohistidine phosphatase SixA [Ktedonobacterales bacterium]
MRLYLMRHGLAGNRDTWTGNDSLRPLTEKGERRTREAAAGLKLLAPAIDTLVTSPLVRARQTAEIVADALHLPLAEQEALSPGFGLAQLAGLLTIYTEARGLMLFGHDPDFSALIGRLIVSRGEAQVVMKKGACCALDLPDETPDPDLASRQLAGSATLLWLMTAKQLALMAT